MSIELIPLGAGQDVGRSCIIVKIYDKSFMLDCGAHMGYHDHRRFPDFSSIKPADKRLDDYIDIVLLSHFHLDHCGALPYMSEIIGFNGPIVMTTPTKAIVPYMLEDFKRVALESKDKDKETGLKDKDNIKEFIEKEIKSQIYTSDHIKECTKKFVTMQLHETLEIKGVKIKTYYAGHVLGACMFLIEYKGAKVVYTGDFNSTSDRHLGAAWIEKVRPDVLITETTYATTLRDSKRARERDCLKQVQDAIDNGGKVLIPVFALGRAQELCILLETYWSRTKSKVPIYFATGLTEKANFYYKLFINWTNQKIKSTFIKNNLFDFKYIKPFDKALIKSPSPMVLFATPGMLHGGLSMQVFKEWVNDERNLLIIPGYCVAGTLGNKLLSGMKSIIIDGKNYDVKMQIKNMSFSAHADAKGILNLIKHAEPKNVVFVHGEKKKMEILREIVINQFNIPVYYPANFEKITIDTKPTPIVALSSNLVVKDSLQFMQNSSNEITLSAYTLQTDTDPNLKIFDLDDTILEINTIIKMIKSDEIDRIIPHTITDGYCIKLPEILHYSSTDIIPKVAERLAKKKLIQTQSLEKIIGSLALETLDSYLMIQKNQDIDDNIDHDSLMIFLEEVRRFFIDY